MRNVLKMLVIPITGAIAITVIFALIVWGGGWKVVDENGIQTTYGDGLTANIVFGPGNPCADLYDPVCGYDEVTYDNMCRAIHAGTKVAYQGNCLE